MPALVAQLDARPTSDQEVAGLTSTGVGSILSWRLIMKYIPRSFYPFANSRGAVVGFLRRNMHYTG